MHWPGSGLTGAQAAAQEEAVPSPQQLQSDAALALALAQNVTAAKIAIAVLMKFSLPLVPTLMAQNTSSRARNLPSLTAAPDLAE